jgi:polyphosphate glucokinase
MAATKPTSRDTGRGTALTAVGADVHPPLLLQARTRTTQRRSGASASTVDRPREQAKSAGGMVRILVIDIGGTNVKVLATEQGQARRLPSGPTMTAAEMVAGVKSLVGDWPYDVVSIGYPGVVIGGRPLHEPRNLGGGWVGFDFHNAFGCRVKMVNDAGMQALGSYEGGRMLFLGLGTGLGSAMIVDGILEPMELAHLPYKKGQTYEQYLGRQALKSLGKKRWRRHVANVVERFKVALEADYIVLGGGNAKKIGELPPGARLGANANAFVGGFRLWEGAETSARALPERV